MHKLGINTLSNILARLWSMVSVYIFVPLYIKILGETSYGLVSFFATLQTALNILGLGLSNTLRREFAVGDEGKDNIIRKYKLLRDVELIYYIIGIVVFFVCYFGAHSISVKWLNIESLDSSLVESVISLMGASIALQMIAHLYSGCLFGLDQQVSANVLCIIWSALKSIGSLLVIMIIQPNLIYFYLWHIIIDSIYLVILRYNISKKLAITGKKTWTIEDFSLLSSIWKYAGGILFISFIVLVNKQLDKVIISKYLTLTEFGAYNVSTSLGNLSTIIPTALYTTVFPQFTKKVTTGDYEELENNFYSINKLVGIIIACTGSYIAVYSRPLIMLWTASNVYVGILGNVSFFVVLAVAVTEYQEIPYALALANGNTKLNVLVGGLFIPIVFLSTFIGITQYGLVGAGIVYFFMMLLQTILYQFLVFRKYLKQSPIKLILTNTIIPLISCLGIAFASRVIWGDNHSTALTCAYAIICGLLTLSMFCIFFAGKDIMILKKR